jgi:hypothetical protein
VSGAFKIVGLITDVEVIAKSHSIRNLQRLNRVYGKARWRKMKGNARIEFANGKQRAVELHWYEAHGIGKKEFKIKRYL